MPVDGRELLQAISIIADERNVRVTVKQSGKGAMICATSCFVGGLLMGPSGLAIGGTVGDLMAYKMTSGKFRSLGDVIPNDLTDTQREQLVQHVTNAVAEKQPADIVLIVLLIMDNASIQRSVLRTVVSYVSNDLRLELN